MYNTVHCVTESNIIDYSRVFSGKRYRCTGHGVEQWWWLATHNRELLPYTLHFIICTLIYASIILHSYRENLFMYTFTCNKRNTLNY